MGDSDVYLGLEPYISFFPFQIKRNALSFSFWNRVRSNSYYFLAELFVTAYLQNRRGDQLDL